MAKRNSRSFRRMGKKEYFQKSAHQYMDEFSVSEIDPTVVAQWMIDTGRYAERPYSKVQRCKRELTAALRDEFITDPKNRHVRRMHCVRWRENDETKSLWADIYDAKPQHMRTSLSQRRRGIQGEVLQHYTDTLSYNDYNNHGAQLALFDYDFNKDVEEHNQPTDYPDENPDNQPE